MGLTFRLSLSLSNLVHVFPLNDTRRQIMYDFLPFRPCLVAPAKERVQF